MTKYLNVFGHFEQLEFLRNSFKKKFHHSWLIYGTRGIGKKKTIKKFIYWSIAEKKGMKKSEEFNEYLNKTYISSVKEINCEEDNKTDMSTIRKIIDDIQLSNFDNRNFIADPTNFIKLTGWKPKNNLNTGLEKTINFILNNGW